MKEHRIYKMSFASVYPHYVKKAQRKDRTKAEVDQIIDWLTGYDSKQLQEQLDRQVNFEEFFEQAPAMNPSRKLITGVVCGIRVEDIVEPLMQEIRYLDKLVDELAKGKAMNKIFRTQQESDFPTSMGKIAPRELANNGIKTIEHAAKFTEKELLAIHGVGPKAVRIIKEELLKKKLNFKKQ